MKKIFQFSMLLACLIMAVSCGKKIKYTPLSDSELQMLTVYTKDGEALYGVCDQNKGPLVPPEYNSIMLYNGCIIAAFTTSTGDKNFHLYRLDGSKIFNKDLDEWTWNEETQYFCCRDLNHMSNLYFPYGNKTLGPFKSYLIKGDKILFDTASKDWGIMSFNGDTLVKPSQTLYIIKGEKDSEYYANRVGKQYRICDSLGKEVKLLSSTQWKDFRKKSKTVKTFSDEMEFLQTNLLR